MYLHPFSSICLRSFMRSKFAYLGLNYQVFQWQFISQAGLGILGWGKVLPIKNGVHIYTSVQICMYIHTYVTMQSKNHLCVLRTGSAGENTALNLLSHLSISDDQIGHFTLQHSDMQGCSPSRKVLQTTAKDDENSYSSKNYLHFKFVSLRKQNITCKGTQNKC